MAFEAEVIPSSSSAMIITEEEKEISSFSCSSFSLSFVSIMEEDNDTLLLFFLLCGDGGREALFLLSLSYPVSVIKEENIPLLLLFLGDQGGYIVLWQREFARVLSVAIVVYAALCRHHCHYPTLTR